MSARYGKCINAITPTTQTQLNSYQCLLHWHSGRNRHVQRKKERPSIERPQALILDVMPPRIDPLPDHIMALRHLCHRGLDDPNRHGNLKVVLVTLEAPPLQLKKFTAHHAPPIRHVANDVFSDVSYIIAPPSGWRCQWHGYKKSRRIDACRRLRPSRICQKLTVSATGGKDRY